MQVYSDYMYVYALDLTELDYFKYYFYRHSSDLQLTYLCDPYVVHIILIVFCHISNSKTLACTQVLKHAVYINAFELAITISLVVHLSGQTTFKIKGIF